MDEFSIIEKGASLHGFEPLKTINIRKEDIGKTRIDCAVCYYTLTVSNGSVPMFCPKCSNQLIFFDVTADMFLEDE